MLLANKTTCNGDSSISFTRQTGASGLEQVELVSFICWHIQHDTGRRDWVSAPSTRLPSLGNGDRPTMTPGARMGKVNLWLEDWSGDHRPHLRGTPRPLPLLGRRRSRLVLNCIWDLFRVAQLHCVMLQTFYLWKSKSWQTYRPTPTGLVDIRAIPITNLSMPSPVRIVFHI